jgi:hypothetical protein
MTSRLRRTLIAATAFATLLTSVNAAAAQPSEATGLERAREAAFQSFDRAKASAPVLANRARGLDEERERGLERAAEVRNAAADEASANATGAEANGDGNAFGRQVTVEAEKNRGQAVRALVHARNASRPADLDEDADD